jgi:hypothetical protein
MGLRRTSAMPMTPATRRFAKRVGRRTSSPWPSRSPGRDHDPPDQVVPSFMSTPTNRKPGAPSETPQEPFKRAVASCMRAMSRTPTLEVTYAADRPNVTGHGESAKARLPEPPRKLSPREAAIVRGHADSMALKLACHDATVHRRLAPDAQAARAVFDAVEQVRVESIGARRMDGVASNLSAMLEDRYHRGNYAEITDRADAPLEDAVALIARERLTGRAPPPAAQKIVDLWRPWIETKAGSDLDQLGGAIEDQRSFGRAVQKLPTTSRNPTPKTRTARGRKARAARPWRWTPRMRPPTTWRTARWTAPTRRSANPPKNPTMANPTRPPRLAARPPAGPTSVAPTTRRSIPVSTRSWPPRTFASPRNWSGSARISTSS